MRIASHFTTNTKVLATPRTNVGQLRLATPMAATPGAAVSPLRRRSDRELTRRRGR